MEENFASADLIPNMPAGAKHFQALLRRQGKLSQDDVDTIKLFSEPRDVIIHNKPAVKLAVHCFGILQRLELKNNGCLVVTPLPAYVTEIVTTMLQLDPECNVKDCDAIIGQYKSTKKVTNANVVVGTSSSALHMVEKGMYSHFDMIFFYSGNEVYNDMELSEGDEAAGVLRFLVKELRVCQKEVQVIFFSERPLSPKGLSLFKMSFADASVISSSDVPDKLTLEGIKKHEYRIVAREAQAKEILKITADALNNSNHVIIYVDFCFSCSGVGCPDCYGGLLHVFGENVPYTLVTCAMDKSELDKCVKSFLDETHLLVTLRVWARDIIRDVSYKVDIIINHITSTAWHREYMKSLGPFQNVKTAITFVAKGGMLYLDALQRFLHFFFEESGRLSWEINNCDWMAEALTNEIRSVDSKESSEQDEKTMRERKERSDKRQKTMEMEE